MTETPTQQETITKAKALPLQSISLSYFNGDVTVEYRFGDPKDQYERQKNVTLKSVDRKRCNQIAALTNNRFTSTSYWFTNGPVVVIHTSSPITGEHAAWFDWSAVTTYGQPRPILDAPEVIAKLVKIMDQLVQERSTEHE